MKDENISKILKNDQKISDITKKNILAKINKLNNITDTKTIIALYDQYKYTDMKIKEYYTNEATLKKAYSALLSIYQRMSHRFKKKYILAYQLFSEEMNKNAQLETDKYKQNKYFLALCNLIEYN